MQTALIDALNSYADASGGGEGVFHTPMPAFSFMRTSHETLPHHRVYKPSLCIVAQGEKEVLVGDATLTYREMQALIVSVEIPALGRVTKASPEKPLLGMVLELDIGIMREVMEELESPRLRAAMSALACSSLISKGRLPIASYGSSACFRRPRPFPFSILQSCARSASGF